MEERLQWLKRHDHWRHRLIGEPRGSEVLVGAFITPPEHSYATCGVIFFNNAGYLGMCGHGTIGLVRTLAHVEKIKTGQALRIDTPVGEVSAVLRDHRAVSVTNVESFRTVADVELAVDGVGVVSGDVAFGGNWFFIVKHPTFEIDKRRTDSLVAVCQKIRAALGAAGITGEGGAEIDHIELLASHHPPEMDSKNFVLCPGGEYDRSPCGTGTSAKMACLYADGKLQPERLYRQGGVLDTVFTGFVMPSEKGVIPSVSGRAYITADLSLVFEEDDPLLDG